MSATAIALVLSSAALHAFWNSLVKRAQDKTAFTWIYVFCAIIVGAPFLIASRGEPIPPRGWLCAFVSGTLYALYFNSMAVMYEHGELSVNYPIARGVAPALTLLWAVLFLNERPSALGLLGVACIIAAVLAMIPSGANSDCNASRGTRAALFTGLLTSCYAITDKLGVGQMGPARFVWITYAWSWLCYSAFALPRLRRERLRDEWHQAGPCAVAVGALSIGSYWILLIAVQSSNVSYVVPLRSLAILFGVALGTGTLGETNSRRKWVGAALMVFGALLIALKG